MSKLAPSILSADMAYLAQAAKWVESGADWLHLDVMDGHFVPAITFGAATVKALRPVTTLPLDVHLMVSNPAQQVPQFITAGAHRITIHAECGDMIPILQTIKQAGLATGIALNPNTPPESLARYITHVDQVVVMTVEPGAGGQPLIESCLAKFAKLRQMFGHDVELVADGGVKASNIAQVARAGATVLVAGSAVYNSGYTRESVAANLAALRQNL
jgi:ribulose-phosphate 3-epimerase